MPIIWQSPVGKIVGKKTMLSSSPINNSSSYHNLATALTATALAASPSPYKLYYGTAAIAANYGGNSDKKASAKYIYDVPEGCKEKPMSKIQKGTNATDSEFSNPQLEIREGALNFPLKYSRCRRLKRSCSNNLALSEVDLQALIESLETVKSDRRRGRMRWGQTYYVYEIDGIGAHSLIAITRAKNKMYAHIHESFKTRISNCDSDKLVLYVH